MNSLPQTTEFYLLILLASATTEVFNAIMMHYYEKPEQVINYFNLLLSDGRKPDSISYDCVLKAYPFAFCYSFSLMHLRYMRKEGEESNIPRILETMESEGITMLERTFAALMQYFGKIQKSDELLQSFQKYSQTVQIEDERTYHNISRALLACELPSKCKIKWGGGGVGIETNNNYSGGLEFGTKRTRKINNTKHYSIFSLLAAFKYHFQPIFDEGRFGVNYLCT